MSEEESPGIVTRLEALAKENFERGGIPPPRKPRVIYLGAVLYRALNQQFKKLEAPKEDVYEISKLTVNNEISKLTVNNEISKSGKQTRRDKRAAERKQKKK